MWGLVSSAEVTGRSNCYLMKDRQTVVGCVHVYIDCQHCDTDCWLLAVTRDSQTSIPGLTCTVVWQYINTYPKTRYCCLSVIMQGFLVCDPHPLFVVMCHRDLHNIPVHEQSTNHISLKRPRYYVKSPTGHAPCGNDSLCTQPVESALPIA